MYCIAYTHFLFSQVKYTLFSLSTIIVYFIFYFFIYLLIYFLVLTSSVQICSKAFITYVKTIMSGYILFSFSFICGDSLFVIVYSHFKMNNYEKYYTITILYKNTWEVYTNSIMLSQWHSSLFRKVLQDLSLLPHSSLIFAPVLITSL